MQIRSSSLVLGLIMFVAAAVAHAQPRACTDWKHDNKGPLPRKDVGNVMYRSVLFNRAGKKYYAETFSDMAQQGNEHCFRWEVVNNSVADKLTIDELSWPAAGIRVRKMLPGDSHRDFNNRRERIEPARRDNPVYAFENKKAPT